MNPSTGPSGTGGTGSPSGPSISAGSPSINPGNNQPDDLKIIIKISIVIKKKNISFTIFFIFQGGYPGSTGGSVPVLPDNNQLSPGGSTSGTPSGTGDVGIGSPGINTGGNKKKIIYEIISSGNNVII